MHSKSMGHHQPVFHKPRTATGVRRRKVKKSKKKTPARDSEFGDLAEEGEDGLDYEGSVDQSMELVSLSALSSLSYQ